MDDPPDAGETTASTGGTCHSTRTGSHLSWVSAGVEVQRRHDVRGRAVCILSTYWEVAAAATAAAATAHIEPTLSTHVLILKREFWHTVVTSLHALGVFIATIFFLVNLALERALLLLEQYPRTLAFVFMLACTASQ